MRSCGRTSGICPQWAAAIAAIVLAALPTPGTTTNAPAGNEEPAISGVRIPEYDGEGRLKSELLGDSVRQLPDGTLEVTRLRLNLYKEGTLEGIAVTPKCVYDRKTRTLSSNSEIALQQGSLMINGVGFRWEGETQTLTILNRSCVILRSTMLWMMKEKMP